MGRYSWLYEQMSGFLLLVPSHYCHQFTLFFAFFLDNFLCINSHFRHKKTSSEKCPQKYVTFFPYKKTFLKSVKFHIHETPWFSNGTGEKTSIITSKTCLAICTTILINFFTSVSQPSSSLEIFSLLLCSIAIYTTLFFLPLNLLSMNILY